MGSSKGSDLNTKYNGYAFALLLGILWFGVSAGISLTEFELFRLQNVGAYMIFEPVIIFVIGAVATFCWWYYYSAGDKPSYWLTQYKKWMASAEWQSAFWPFVVMALLLFMVALAFLVSFVGLFGFSVDPQPKDISLNTIGNFGSTGLEDDYWLSTNLFIYTLSTVTLISSVKFFVVNTIAIGKSGNS